MTALAAVLLLTAGGVQKGGTLYIKGSAVTMTERADGGGKKTPLQAGDAVTWNGPSDADKSIHQIEFKGKRGFVPMSSLTPNRPQAELTNDGKSTSAAAFAPSGAKVCDFPGPRRIAEPTLDATLMFLEGSSDEQKKAVPAHAKAAGLERGK